MRSSVTLDRLLRTDPPVYEGTYDGRVLQVRLDSSALMALRGTSADGSLDKLLDPPPPLVTNTARRLVELRQFEPASDGVIVTISALDLY